VRPGLPSGQRDALILLADGSLGQAVLHAEIDGPAIYRETLGALADVDPLARRGAAERLARLAGKRGPAPAFELVRTVLRRALRARLETLGPPVFEGEGRLLAALAPGDALDHWGHVWENLGRLAGQVEGLRLDPTQAFLHLLEQASPA
jgi:hypothetical protein